MKKIGFRHCNMVDMGKTFSASMRGGCRGLDDNTMAIDSFSNDIFPCVKTFMSFTVLVEVYEEKSKCCTSRQHSR